MKYPRYLTPAMVLTVMLAACSDEKNEPDGADGRTALSINAGIDQTPDADDASAARAIDAAWQVNDAIGIVMLNAGTGTTALATYTRPADLDDGKRLTVALTYNRFTPIHALNVTLGDWQNGNGDDGENVPGVMTGISAEE